ncbi:hypothetical protein VV02_12250 [Luteipulveratus mongoliensis]|uniref:M23ase beta-sheet core domain-containing protein n=2 Tax=Luteipulveratus mongoliensis TaxID=571913 RepID=A0A0K1JQ67_9MICO|nr:hypothetical protein VV02_12250 [Luteipulveratus mongoliensis]
MSAEASQGSKSSTMSNATAKPNFQLPFSCGTTMQLDSWARHDHAPALDIRTHPLGHQEEGRPVLASAGGTVKESSYDSGAGNYVLINHGGGWYTVYIHLQSKNVRAGQKVALGTVIGKLGHSGANSNGVNHLHYEQLYDANHNGHLDWGVPGGEDRPAVFNGAKSAKDVHGKVTSFGTPGGEWLVKSHNRCGSNPTPPKPPKPGHKKYYVDTFANAAGYAKPGSHRTGTLNKGKNYVFCKAKGPKVQHGSQYNSWWLKTDLDSGSPWKGQYVSAYYLSRWGSNVAKDNSGTTIPTC